MDERLVEQFRRIAGADAVLNEPIQLLTYECDALPHLRETPALVVLPGSAAEVQAELGVALPHVMRRVSPENSADSLGAAAPLRSRAARHSPVSGTARRIQNTSNAGRTPTRKIYFGGAAARRCSGSCRS